MKKSLGSKTIAYPTPVWIIGTFDKNGDPNIMTAAWGGICCSKPPCVTISLRKATYTYNNLVAQKAFTISIPSEDYVTEADYIGIVSGRDVDKFSRLKLTPIKSSLVNAPYVEEFPLILECEIIHIYEIGLHTQFIGEIRDVKVNDSVLNNQGQIMGERLKPIIFGPGGRSYHGIGRYLGEAFKIGRDLIEDTKPGSKA